MNTAELIAAIERIAPPGLAEPWDNVGLLVGEAAQELRSTGVLLTIDLTEKVFDEASASDVGAIIAYHPPLFAPIKRLTAATASERVILGAIRRGLCIYSPHTALDAAPGGVTDWLIDLASGAGSTGRTALTSSPAQETEPRRCKVVTFVPSSPPELLGKVREAMARAGAGVIGAYDLCSFSQPGFGTFRGSAASNPAVGRRGELERVDEFRLEMVCPTASLGAVVAALRKAHPYEEPALDLYPLVSPPQRETGAGRAVTLSHPQSAREIAARLKEALPGAVIQLAEAGEGRISRIGACPGSGASLLDAAAREGCGLFLTGELKHHEVRGAVERGVSVLLAGHTETERGYLPVLARRLQELLPHCRPIVSREDQPPLRPV